MIKPQDYSNLLEQPSLLKEASKAELEKLANDYPFSAGLQMLYTKKLQLDNDPDYEQQLSKTAILVPDRRKLFQLMTTEEAPAIIVEDPLIVEEVKEEIVDEPIEEQKEQAAEAIAEEVAEVDEPENVTPEEATEPEVAEPSEEQVEQSESEQDIPTGFGLPMVDMGHVEAFKEMSEDEVEEEPAMEASEKEPEAVEEEPVNEEITPETTEPLVVEDTPVTEEKKTQPVAERRSFNDWLRQANEGFNKAEQNSVEAVTKGFEELSKSFEVASYEATLLKESAALEAEEGYQPLSLEETEELQMADLAKSSVKEDAQLVTESLAKIYLLQKKYQKALDAYRTLAKQHPEKADHFNEKAAEIEKEMK